MKKIPEQTIGIDVGKRRLECSLGGAKSRSFDNTKAGLRALVAGIVKSMPPEAPIFLEASGGYERLAIRALQEAGLRPKLVHSTQARHLAKAMGVAAKTDAIDAVFLAAKGSHLPSRDPLSLVEDEARSISRHISRITQHRTRMLAHLDDGCSPAEVSESAKRIARLLEEERSRCEKEFDQKIKGTSLEKMSALAMSIPGVGPATARIVVSELADRVQGYSASQLSSYAGLAPMDDASGGAVRAKRIRKGNSRIKAALYMAAIALLNSPWGKPLYSRLRAKGRSHRQAAVALMRKVFVRIVAVLKRGTPWTQEAPPP